MEFILISKLKSHLSATIKEVIKGKEYIVLDRTKPVARLQPLKDESGLVIRPPTKKYNLPRNLPKLQTDQAPNEYLMNDRNSFRF
jgi:antitoxin (DNA-binding transcriptional repressor) of toxin-antitoxin stability system